MTPSAKGKVSGQALLNRREAAEYLSMAYQVFSARYRDGLIPEPAYDTVRNALWCRVELDAWAEHGCASAADWKQLWPKIRKERG